MKHQWQPSYQRGYDLTLTLAEQMKKYCMGLSRGVFISTVVLVMYIKSFLYDIKH